MVFLLCFFLLFYLTYKTYSTTQDIENRTVYRPKMIKRIVFFAMIYEGANDFQSVAGGMSFRVGNDERVCLKLNNPARDKTRRKPNRSFYAAASISCDSSTIKITKNKKYFKNHLAADNHYRFGFNWKYELKQQAIND